MSSLDVDAFVTDLRTDPAGALHRHGERVPELAAMRGCPQPRNHHSEGDVWSHTGLALEALADLPALVRRHAGADLVAAGLEGLALPPRSLTQTVAVLLHDAAKPRCIAGADGAWTYHGHDHEGAELALELMDRLDLAGAAARQGAVLDADAVAWLVREHLFWLTADPDRVTDRAVARRFVRDDGRDEDLRVLMWCDTLGSRGPDGRPHLDLLIRAEARLAGTRARASAPPPPGPPLDGNEVMALVGLDPGPKVGLILDWLTTQAPEDPPRARELLARERARLRAM